MSRGFNKPLAFLILFVFLIGVNLLVGENVQANFFLGIISAFIAIGTKKFLDSDVAGLSSGFLLGVGLIPFFAYLIWYSQVGVYTVLAWVATNYLTGYVMTNFVTSLPSTLAGTFGSILVEILGDF